MQPTQIIPPSIDRTAIAEKVFFTTFILALALVSLKAWADSVSLEETFVTSGSDHTLRLVSVRNWLGGQGWFDTTEYRMMPPDGVLMHWSRYIDAMIGGIISGLAWFVPIKQAEMLAVAIWPTILTFLMLGVVGFGTRRLFGPVAAVFSILFLLAWPYTSDAYFRAGKIDHHNAQILMTAILTMAVIWPNKPRSGGIVAGIAAAFGLAIGLETLPYILAMGLLLFLRATFGIGRFSNQILSAFCISVGISAVLFWVGQTPFTLLLSPVCDQLGLPVLSLIGIAAVASILPQMVGLHHPILRLGASVAVIAIGCALAWPLLGPCVAGPYGALPVVVQDIIRSSISEARPGAVSAQLHPLPYIRYMLPVACTLIIGALFWKRMDKTDDASGTSRDIIGQLLILTSVGIIASFFQIRLLLMTAGTVPVLAGFILAKLLAGYLKGRDGVAGLQLIGASILVITPFVITDIAREMMPKVTEGRGTNAGSCRDNEALAALNDIPPAVLLTPLNLGSLVLLKTHHLVVSGPYHRSPDAFANGVIPFDVPQEEMKTYVSGTGAEYLIICDDPTNNQGFASELAQGATADWLSPVPLDAGNIMVFRMRE